MDWKRIESIAKSLAEDAEKRSPKQKQFYLKQKEVAQVLGCGIRIAAEFLVNKRVPYYRVGKEKIYFLPEVLEAVEGTRWTDPRKNA